MAWLPWGWYFPMTSPTTRAHFMNERSGRAPTSSIPHRIRRCTGLRPSRTSGRARAVRTDMAYSRKERSISSWISIGSISTRMSPSSPGGSASLIDASDVEEPNVVGVGDDEVLAALDVLTHEDRHDLV